jgi:hypothetical protein
MDGDRMAKGRTWQPIASAPRDGRPVLVRLHASEQGPAEGDVVRWAVSARSGEGAWVAADSDAAARVAYGDGEIMGWLPLPGQRADPNATRAQREGGTPAADESEGSGI